MTRYGIALAGFAIWAAASPAQQPGAAAPTSYAITPDVGPWTICAASFVGEQAGRRAHDLVTELRTQYRLPAYLFNRGEELRREQQREVDARRREKEDYLRRQGIDPTGLPIRIPRARIEDQFAVLIGGYRDMDAAHKELERIKKLPAPRSVPADTLLQKEPDQTPGKPAPEQRTAVNPLGNAFVTHNPTVPVARAEAQPDPFLKQLNAGEPRSLLKCKQPWTLMVKEFYGAMAIQPVGTSGSFLDKLFSDKTGEQLSAAASNAHNLAEALEKCGFKEVYVLHTRNSSIVTVGGFAGPDDRRIEQVRQMLISRFKFATNDARAGSGADLIGDPVPVAVPRL
jgi:hypothetical protein